MEQKSICLRPKPAYFLGVFITGLALSAISPHDRLTWWLEVIPGIVIAAGLSVTSRRFQFSTFLYSVFLIHGLILVTGGHFTYAEVPFFNWGARNNFDKIGHFFQGLTPALAGREFFLRRNIFGDCGWLTLLLFLSAAGISATYEIIEWLAAEILGSDAESFLGTQGYQWDTQTDMLCACLGAAAALIILGQYHRRIIDGSREIEK